MKLPDLCGRKRIIQLETELANLSGVLLMRERNYGEFISDMATVLGDDHPKVQEHMRNLYGNH